MEKIYVKNKKMFKNKTQMIIYILLFCLIIYGFIYLAGQDYNENIADNEKFSNNFNLVEKDNVFIYINASDARMITKGAKGIILFGTENEWVNYYAYMVNKVAKEVGITKIYYYDITKNRKDNNGTYEDIVNTLSNYVIFNDKGVADLYAPSLLVANNDEIIYFDDETSLIRGNITPQNYWSDENILNKENEIKDAFLKYLD